ncbi:hypothetical protein ABRY94_11810 [Castellaniella ginsengisoli]|uniref:Uncharacterized protein n=1 Tax=Castellaniella ginsengisoli TaxID=546114 RepID=A0AB39ER44_9BURK
MIFCLSVSDTEGRVILDDESHGDTLAVIEARTWIEARGQALGRKEMDPFDYRPGFGWALRKSCPATPAGPPG